MFRTVVLVWVAVAGASRIQVNEAAKGKFGASCDELQTMFRNRVAAFKSSYDAIDNFEAISRATQARLMMRTYGIVRTLRRARTCSWVEDDNSEDLEQARSVVHDLLAGNPCAEVARSELEAGRSAETAEDQTRAIQRAMWVLTSDDCDVTVPTEETANLDHADVLDEMREAEDDLQDAIDEMGDDSEEGAFIQTEGGTVSRFFRGLGVVLFLLFFALACTGVMAFIGMAIGVLVAVVQDTFLGWNLRWYLGHIVFGFLAGGVVGLVGCVYETFDIILPRLTR